jgi:hypothetical protein
LTCRGLQSMGYKDALANLAVVAALAGPCGAQAARIGRLPVLQPLSSNVRACTSGVTPGELQRQHISRIFDVTEAPTGRHLSLGVDDAGTPRALTAMLGTREARRGESESVFVFLGPNGSIVRGWRTAMTGGVPARVDEDRRSGLLPGDTSQIKALVRALRRICHP